MNKLDISKLGSEDIQDMFTNAFEEKIARYNNITEFECKAIKDSVKNEITVEVMIVGFARSPNIEDFKNGKVTDSKIIKVPRDGFEGEMVFKLNKEKIVGINTTDYLLVYDLVK